MAFLHSHPFPGWQGMSQDDVVAETRMAPTCFAISGLPLLGLTIGTDGSWSARFWIKSATEKRKYERNWCGSVRVQGKDLQITFNDQLIRPSLDHEKQLRTISAWGRATQNELSQLTVGIVGLGSVGSIVAEILARIGIRNFYLIDYDSVEEKNLDRLTNVFVSDIDRAKVKAIRDAIKRSASAPDVNINTVEYSICEEEGFLAGLDCDILFSCVDRPWGRQVLNFISYAHLIPVIDGGILVRTSKDNTCMLGADWKAQTIGYDRPCLECLGQYSSTNAILEKGGYLDDPDYIKGMKDKGSLDVHENVYAFSSHLASMEVLQMLNLFIAPSGIANIGQQMHHLVTGVTDIEHKQCLSSCYFQTVIGKGDFSGVKVTGQNKIAEDCRHNRQRNKL
ncbi:MAG: ThiF family adenylyltransferase [Chitinophagaceae bacterium]|nr:ThiF family adenylyltransferase [Chitinophagaceae bacterium]